MKIYTVFLLYPDYAIGDHRAAMYVESVEAEDYKKAVEKVKAMARIPLLSVLRYQRLFQ